MARPEHNPDVTDCECFGCHIRSVQWSPAATPTRRNHLPSRRPSNSWERGTPTDNRGMPLLGPDLKPIGQKKYSENRSTIEAALRDIRNNPNTNTPTP